MLIYIRTAYNSLFIYRLTQNEHTVRLNNIKMSSSHIMMMMCILAMLRISLNLIDLSSISFSVRTLNFNILKF